MKWSGGLFLAEYLTRRQLIEMLSAHHREENNFIINIAIYRF